MHSAKLNFYVEKAENWSGHRTGWTYSYGPAMTKQYTLIDSLNSALQHPEIDEWEVRYSDFIAPSTM